MVIRHHVTKLPRGRLRPRPSQPTARWPFAGAADAPVHVVHLSCADALRHVAEARARGVRATAETCPHYLALTDDRYDETDPIECAKSVISPPLRPAADQDALWAGLAAGD